MFNEDNLDDHQQWHLYNWNAFVDKVVNICSTSTAVCWRIIHIVHVLGSIIFYVCIIAFVYI